MKSPLLFLRSSFVILSFLSLPLSADEILISDWLKSIEGSSGETLNAEVLTVEQINDMAIIDIKLPVDNLEDYEIIEIIDKNTKKPVNLTQKPQQLKNEKEEPYGIRFQIKRIPGFEFRVQLRDDTDQVLP